MTTASVLIIGSGHLAYRIKMLASARGYEILHLTRDALGGRHVENSAFDGIMHGLRAIDLSAVARVYLVDDQDEDNLELLIALVDRGPDALRSHRASDSDRDPGSRAGPPFTVR